MIHKMTMTVQIRKNDYRYDIDCLRIQRTSFVAIHDKWIPEIYRGNCGGQTDDFVCFGFGVDSVHKQ